MDHAAYHVVYVDNRANNDLDGRYIQKPRPEYSDGSELGKNDTWEFPGSEYVELILTQIEEVRDNIKCILSNFNGGMFHPPREMVFFLSPFRSQNSKVSVTFY